MSWEALFERGTTATVADVREALARRRNGDPDQRGKPREERQHGDDAGQAEPSPARVAADADVLAADLLVGGDARDALDHVRAHSWVTLVASDPLLADAEAVVAALADADLAADWREHADSLSVSVATPAGDHPALAAAYRGGAMHVLTFDEGLQSAAAGAAVRGRVETSLKSPAAFARLFDPESLYGAVREGDYPGPDRDPRA